MKRFDLKYLVLMLAVFFLFAGADRADAFRISSPAIKSGGLIDAQYTCDGRNVSPPLKWSAAPKGVKSFALIMDDPDAPAGTWVHWVVYNLPATATSLPEAVSTKPTLPDGSLQGSNSWRKIGYGGPCPPSGRHRYYFKLYALDKMLDLPSGATKQKLLKAMEKHILGQAEVLGRFR